jgi:F-type H+-transporting ATPase subunit gamma
MFSSSDIEKKIKTFHAIEDIVSAMKAYAGVTIRKTEELVLNVRAYEDNMLYAMADIIAHYPRISFEKSEGKRILMAFGSSQGLCGPFNEKIADVISDAMNNNDTLFIIGRRLKSSIESRHITYDGYSDSIVSVSGIPSALKELVSQIMKIYKKEEYYNLTFVFTYISEKRPKISIEQILPPDVTIISALKPIKVPPLIYLEPRTIFDKILEEFLYITLYRGYLESLRSENWYRLRSMEGASENLKMHISELDSLQKYVRQEEITEEMLEILGSGMFYRW